MFVDKKTMGGHQLGTKVPQLHILFAGREYWFSFYNVVGFFFLVVVESGVLDDG